MSLPRVMIGVACASQIAVGVWIGTVVLPRDAQSAIALVFVAPVSLAGAGALVGVARPGWKRAAIGLLLAYACLWIALLPWGGLGSFVLAAMLLVPSMLAGAVTAAVFHVLTAMIADVIGGRKSAR